MAYTTINKSSDYFNTKLWTGTGSNGNAISGVGFAPDLVWVKNRSGSYDNVLFDRVRGDNKHVESNNTSSEENEANTLAFGSDGYSVGTNTLNNSGSNIVGWNWKANGAGSANTDGTISSTVSVNTTSGFSIVSYTGTQANATVGHGLGSAPSLIILKNRTSPKQWQIFHHKNTSAPATQQLEFGTDATATVTSQWNSIMPTSSVFSIGTNNATNESGQSIIAYCFAEKTGYSKFGSYTGNGNADGTFVYTGFKPAWIMQKSVTTTYGWQIYDNRRSGFNSDNDELAAHNNAAESNGSGNGFPDILSNGFKLRNTDVNKNASGVQYIYMAFAEAPLVGSNNVPCTAR